MGLAGDVREMGGVPVACGEARVCDSAGTGVLTGQWIFAGHAGRQGTLQRFPAVRFGGCQSGSEEVPLGGEGYGGVPVGAPVACSEVRVCDSAGTGVLTGRWIFVGRAGRQGAFQRFPAVRLGGCQSGSEEVPLGGEGYGGVPVGAPDRRSLCTPPWCAGPLRKGHRLVG